MTEGEGGQKKSKLAWRHLWMALMMKQIECATEYEPCGKHLNINFPWISGQSKARRNLFDHKIRIRAPVRSRERYLYIHEPNQRRDHLRYRALRVNQRHHWSQPQGPSSLGNTHYIFVIVLYKSRFFRLSASLIMNANPWILVSLLVVTGGVPVPELMPNC